ncbi:hypothetical protein GEOBRER4_n0878 [Citrifermentans bremense]|uniref:Uncharacterized protein n=1 Tax=Citrifermentans bremense TaxID=60035 RepID=A0A7R7FRZ2_9BACT|nr:hypothetical protein GEOBRER4_n0878 [Citrifermentans bremense]
MFLIDNQQLSANILPNLYLCDFKDNLMQKQKYKKRGCKVFRHLIVGAVAG